ncbi:MAG: hypothetical protein JWR77_1952 [Rhizorhabdus sp.]|nr:hypothetical protein [Rhizorhabdus sp.]
MAGRSAYIGLMIAAGASQASTAAGIVDMTCEACGNLAPSRMSIGVRWKPASIGADYRTLFAPKGDVDIQGEWIQRRKSLSIGDDGGRLSLQAERGYARKRIVPAGITAGRQRLSSIVLGLRYDLDSGVADHLAFAVSQGQEKRRFDIDLTEGHWSSSHFVEARADWIHNRHWRLSAAWSASRGDGRLTGVQRSVQLVHGATASRSGFRLAADYSPAGFGARTPLSIGVLAGADRLSSADTASYGLQGRADSRLALDLRLRF